MENFLPCDICYDSNRMLHELSCCNNTKHICQSCLDSLIRKKCPWCRSALDQSLFSEILVSHSAPLPETSWGEFFEVEANRDFNEISPQEYASSRILRRQINSIRRRYLTETNNRNRYANNLTGQERRSARRRQRRQLRDYARQVQNNYQDDEIFLFEI